MHEPRSTSTSASPELAAPDADWIGYRGESQDRRLIRWSAACALLVHGGLFLVHFPSLARDLPPPEPAREVFVLRPVRFRPPPPPPPDPPQPRRRARRVPMPDPTPRAPEPLREPELAFDLDVAVADEFELPAFEMPAPPPPGPIWVRGEVTRPRRIHEPMPVYTEPARRARVQGIVVLQTVIGADGRVGRVEVLKGLPLGLTEAAVAAVERWRFEPATLDGKPVAVYFNLTVRFDLQG